MTKEEREKAIRKLTEIKNNYERSLNLNTDFSENDSEDELYALELAIRVLKQEPCGDAISRKALMSHIENERREWGEDYDLDQLLGDIEDFPSITTTKEGE